VSGIATIQLEVLVKPFETEKPPLSTANGHAAVLYQIVMKQTLMAIGPLGLGPLRAVGLSPTRNDTKKLDGIAVNDYEAAIGHNEARWWLTTVDEVLSDEILEDFHKKAPTWGRCREVIRVSVRSLRPEPAKVWSGEHMWSLENYGTEANEDLRYTARMMSVSSFLVPKSLLQKQCLLHPAHLLQGSSVWRAFHIVIEDA
jgi:hypothetical protein